MAEIGGLGLLEEGVDVIGVLMREALLSRRGVTLALLLEVKMRV
jgi:hypothetical protein